MQWKNDIELIACDVYLGPHGTEPEDRKLECYETGGMIDKMNQWEKQKEEFKVKFMTHN
jgi:hypothetical protein